MLGLVSSWKLAPISADYTKDKLQLYREVLLQVSDLYERRSENSKAGFTRLLTKLLDIDIKTLSAPDKEQFRKANSAFRFGRECPDLCATSSRSSEEYLL